MPIGASAALATADALAALDRAAHAETKLRVREPALAGVRDGIARIAAGGGPADW